MRIGETPSIKINLVNGDFNAFDDGILIFKQDRICKLEMNIKQGVVLDGSLYLPRLTQEETQKFVSDKDIEVQMKLAQMDAVVATNIASFQAGRVLSNTLLNVSGETTGNTIEITLNLQEETDQLQIDANAVLILLSEDIRLKIDEIVEEKWQSFFEDETSKFHQFTELEREVFDSNAEMQFNSFNALASQKAEEISQASTQAIADIDTRVESKKGEIATFTDSEKVRVTEEGTRQVALVEEKGNEKIAEIEEIIVEAGKVDDVLLNGTSVVTDKIANLTLYTNEEIDEKIEQATPSDYNDVKKEVASNERRITNLEYASKGVLYREEVSEGEDYTKDILSGTMPYGLFDKLGGKTIVWNQLSPISSFVGVVGRYGYFDLLKIKENIFENHIYYFSAKTDEQVVFHIVGTQNGAYKDVIFRQNDFIFTNISYYADTLYIREFNDNIGMQINTSDIRLVDLTKRYGAGNEPTSVDDERIKLLVADLEANPNYNAGTLTSADVVSVESRGNDWTETKPISSIISKYFPTGMKSAGSVYDELDLERGKAVKNVGEANLDDYTWSYYGNSFWYGGATDLLLDAKLNSAQGIVNYLSTYPTTQVARIVSSRQVRIYNADSQSSPNGLLYYELATPIETDIAEEDLEALRTLHVEELGTLTFKQEGLHIPVPNKETYLVKVV